MFKPYTEEYYKHQLETFNNKLNMQVGEVKKKNDFELVMQDEFFGRLTGYMCKDMRSWGKLPMLKEKGMIWMSITPLEIDSHYVPIINAQGKVGVAGLGLGYYIQNILNKEDVESVDVYELNQDVIDLYLDNFGEHRKLKIIKEDVRKMSGKEYTYFYCDIYPKLLDDAIPNDYSIITSNNEIDNYHFWGLEAMLVYLMIESGEEGIEIVEKMPFYWRYSTQRFLKDFNDSKYYDFVDLPGCSDECISKWKEVLSSVE